MIVERYIVEVCRFKHVGWKETFNLLDRTLSEHEKMEWCSSKLDGQWKSILWWSQKVRNSSTETRFDLTKGYDEFDLQMKYMTSIFGRSESTALKFSQFLWHILPKTTIRYKNMIDLCNKVMSRTWSWCWARCRLVNEKHLRGTISGRRRSRNNRWRNGFINWTPSSGGLRWRGRRKTFHVLRWLRKCMFFIRFICFK